MAGGFSTLLSRLEKARRISAVEGSAVMEIVVGECGLDLLVESIRAWTREEWSLKRRDVYNGRLGIDYRS
jgi:hypothetical protein